MFVIRNKRTKDFVTRRWYIVTNDINKARVFNKINHCTCAITANKSYYDKDLYEILELEIKLKENE